MKVTHCVFKTFSLPPKELFIYSQLLFRDPGLGRGRDPKETQPLHRASTVRPPSLGWTLTSEGTDQGADDPPIGRECLFPRRRERLGAEMVGVVGVDP